MISSCRWAAEQKGCRLAVGGQKHHHISKYLGESRVRAKRIKKLYH